MRKLTILIAFLMAVLFTGTAFASDEQEQLIHEQFGTGSYATWLRDDGTWDNGKPGTFQSTKPHEYSIPAEKLKNYKLTRIEVKTGYSFDPEAFEKAGGWQRLSKYEDYEREILRYTPDNLTVTDTHDLATGKVNIIWSLKLNPTQPPENKREARETVDLNVREHLRQLGFNLEDEEAYADFREGWLWCLPVYIEWYGVPKQAVQPPDFSVTLDRYEFKDMNPGDRITITAVYKLNESHTQNEKAILKAFHEVNGTQYPVTLEPVDPANQLNNHIIEFSPGETKQYKVKVTAQDTSSKIITKVWPAEAANDADWSNNSDEALIQVEAPCTDISVTLINPFKYDGESGVVPLDAIIRRAHDGPDGPVTVKVRLRGVGVLTGPEFTKTLKQGQSQTIRYTVDLPVNPQKYTYTGTVEPIGVEDCRPSNNRDTYTFTVTPPPVIPKTTSGIDAGITGGGGFR